jgi:hypothetical protein
LFSEVVEYHGFEIEEMEVRKEFPRVKKELWGRLQF